MLYMPKKSNPRSLTRLKGLARLSSKIDDETLSCPVFATSIFAIAEMHLTFAANHAGHPVRSRHYLRTSLAWKHSRLPRMRAETRLRAAASTEEFSIPWSLHIAEQANERDKAAQLLKEVLQQQRDEAAVQLRQSQDKAAQQLQQSQDKAAQQLREIGQLQAQKAQMLQELVSARGEIDVRGAIEIIARIEERSMPDQGQRRGVQTILRWMVTQNRALKDRIAQVCGSRKLEQSRIRNILHNNLYDTVSKNLHGTSHAHLTVCEGKPWSPNDAAAICILFDAMGLQYQYRDRTGMVIPSPYTYI